MRRSRGILVFAIACWALGGLHFITMIPGFIETYPPLPVAPLQILYRFLPPILGILLGIGLFFWDRGIWGKAIISGAIPSLLIYQIFLFSMLISIVVYWLLLYLSVKYLRIRPWKRPATALALETNPSPKRWRIRSLDKGKAIKAVVICSLVIGTALSPFLNTFSPLTTPPEQPTNPDAGLDFNGRKAAFLTRYGKDLGDPSLCAILDLTVNEAKVTNRLVEIEAMEDGQDFAMNKILRFLYLENSTNPSGKISENARSQIRTTFLGAKLWFTEPGPTNQSIYWTENHQIAFHAAELLAGQLWNSSIFTRSQINGSLHVARAETMIEQWIEWRAKYGFAEHSNAYYAIDIYALYNIADFAENVTIATKAAMLLDIIFFELACNWFKGKFATTMGRSYGEQRIGTGSTNLPEAENIAEVAWIVLGLGRDVREVDQPSVAAVTSTYQPPAVLEKIAENATPSFEQHESYGAKIADGPALGIPYDEDHLMFWWGLAAPVTQWTIDTSFATMDKYQIDPSIVCGTGIPELLEGFSAIRGMPLSTYAASLKEITQGVALETRNAYTYRTSYYQLSGAQDHQKGLNGLQDLTWQASLNDYATVFTNAPGGISFKGGEFMGGWKPRSTFYKNVGIIQYDHYQNLLEVVFMVYLMDSALNLFQGDRAYNHAYFPTWAFDSVIQRGHWVFGDADGGYIALYSANPTFWATDYELQSIGGKNCWIVEMGSAAESGTFDEFICSIAAACVKISPQILGYQVGYESPSQGRVEVAWDGPMTVAGVPVDLGPYDRFDNTYSNTVYGSLKTVIEFDHERLNLDFSNANRSLEIV